MERTLARTEARLHDKEVECESLAVQLTKAEKEGEELRKRWVCRGGGLPADCFLLFPAH